MTGRIITFYSYKGGTGRSMALANVAWILASNGKRVLVIDWDLEAPGLHRYFHPLLFDNQLIASPGIIDLMWDFAAGAMDPTAPDRPDWYEAFAQISPYAQSIRHRFESGGTIFEDGGTIDLVPAGRQGSSYSTQVDLFDWGNFYERLGGGIFLEALKARIRDQYDFILIDSRTGVSDTAGICTVQLPDILVNCFSSNTQSIEGAAAAAESVRLQRDKNGLQIFPIPMRIEDGEKDKLESARDYWRILHHSYLEGHVANIARYWGEVEIPYRSFYAYEEILATIGDRPGQENTILSACERIVSYLTQGAITGLIAISEQRRRELLDLYQRSSSSDPVELSSHAGGSSRVFISFAHEDAEHEDRVREFWTFLRAHGIDARLDMSAAQRRQDWPLWMLREVRHARFVLVVASPAYRQRAEGEVPAGEGRGVQFEASLIRQEMYADREEAVN